MKKVLFISFVMLFGFILVACNDTSSTTESMTESTTQSTTEFDPSTTTEPTVTQTSETTVTTDGGETVELGAAYDGTHTVSAMGSEVVYTYYYEFADGSYTFSSSFEMGGEPYEYEETGTYVVTSATISFTPTEGDPYTGTITDETTISVPIKASSMASRGTEYPLTLREGE